MRTIDIPGGTAVIRERNELTERQRRAVRNTMLAALGDQLGDMQIDEPNMRLKITPELPAQLFAMRDVAILQGLVSWTLPDPVRPGELRPLPADTDEVLDLPGDVYDALANECQEAIGGLFTDVSPSPDPARPTSPSSGSNGPLRDAEQPTITWSGTGGSSNTANATL